MLRAVDRIGGMVNGQSNPGHMGPRVHPRVHLILQGYKVTDSHTLFYALAYL